MDFLLHAAYLNNMGASAFSANNGLAAFECFRSALQVLVLNVPQGNQILGDCATTKLLLLQPHRFHCLMRPDLSDLPPQQIALDPHVFSKAFLFQPREDQRELALQIRTYSAMIFFNLAASLHQRSASMQRNKEQALNAALELYDVGFDLLIQEESLDDWSNNVSLAILNNMAEVHVALSNFSKARRLLELQKGLLEIISSNKRPHNFSEQEMEIFILNTHLLQAPAGAAAA